jgi:hypothetical protein
MSAKKQNSPPDASIAGRMPFSLDGKLDRREIRALGESAKRAREPCATLDSGARSLKAVVCRRSR